MSNVDPIRTLNDLEVLAATRCVALRDAIAEIERTLPPAEASYLTITCRAKATGKRWGPKYEYRHIGRKISRRAAHKILETAARARERRAERRAMADSATAD